MKLISLILLLSLFSCKGPFKWAAFKQCIESAPAIMDYPAQIEGLGKSHHAIAGYQRVGRESYSWISCAYFGGRYELTFSIDVMLNDRHTKVIKILGEPEFELSIIEEITKGKKGGIGASYEATIKFGKAELKEMLQAKGDTAKILAVLNIDVKPPLPLFDERCKARLPLKGKLIKLSKDEDAK